MVLCCLFFWLVFFVLCGRMWRGRVVVCLGGVGSSVVMFGARGDVGDWRRWFSYFHRRGGFLPGVASGLLVLCGSFLCGRDWGGFRSGTAVARVFENGGVFGAWLAERFRRVVFGDWLGRGAWSWEWLFRHGCWRAYPARGGVDCLAGQLTGVWREWFSSVGAGVVVLAIGCFWCVIGARVFGRGFRW